MLVCIVGVNIGLKLNAIMILGVFGMIVLIFHYELINAIYLIFKNTNTANLVSIGVLMLSSIFSGAYFSIELFGETLKPFVSWISFYHLNEIYYGLVGGQLSHINFIYAIIYISASIAIATFNYKKST